MAAPIKGRASAHCLLISANRVIRPYPVYPIGIAHLLGALEERGHHADHVDILSSDGYEELLRMLSENSYDVVGISIRNIDTVDSHSPTAMLDDISKVLQHVRKLSEAPVVLGGPGFSIMPEQLLSYLKADYGIVGEGEAAFPNLIDTIMSGRQPTEQKLFSHSLECYPDCTPVFTREVCNYYTSHGGMLSIQTKRGCSYGCSYCSYPAIEGKKIRYRRPQSVVEDIYRLKKDYGARYIFFTDAVFNDHSNHHLKIAEALIKSGNTTPWSAFFRPQNLTTSDLRLLKKSGLAAMELGTDCASDETLAGINKGFSFGEVVELNRLIVAESLPCAHFIMFGGPGETEKTVHQGIENLKRLENCIVFAYVGLRILPGTKLYETAKLEGIIDYKTDIIQPVFYYSPHVQREFIDQELRLAFKGQIDRIYPMEDMEEYARLFHSMGHTGPLWDLLLLKRLRQ